MRHHRIAGGRRGWWPVAVRPRAAAALAAVGLVACAPARPDPVASLPTTTTARPADAVLHGAWVMEVPDSVRARMAGLRTAHQSLHLGTGGRATLSTGDAVDGAYRVTGRELAVIAAGDTAVALVAHAAGRMAPLLYEMRDDTLWWRGGGAAPVPLRSWVPALERERRLPAGLWRHAWLPDRGEEATLQLSAGGCARFLRSTGSLTRRYRVAGDTLRLGFGGFLGIPDESRYDVRGDTLRLDFTFAGRRGPEPMQLRFVRQRYEMLDPAARCAVP